MTKFKFELGDEVKDIITGFKGFVTGRAEHVTGCNTYGLTSKIVKENSGSLQGWYDENRLKLVKKTKLMEEINKNENEKKESKKPIGACGNPQKSHGKL